MPRRLKVTRAVVPSLFTTLNLYCGFLSIVEASQSNIENAAWFIILAGIFDSLDGVMARITRSSSQFGVELDSLADVVSFGAAPSFMIWKASLASFGNVGLLLAAFPLVFGAIRLARFNVQLVGFDKDHFIGLPIPIQAITLCAFMLHFWTPEFGLGEVAGGLLPVLTVALGLLMVSRVRYETLPKLTRKAIIANPWRVVGFGVAALAVIFSKGAMFFMVLIIFVGWGIVHSLLTWLRKPEEIEKEEEAEATRIDV